MYKITFSFGFAYIILSVLSLFITIPVYYICAISLGCFFISLSQLIGLISQKKTSQKFMEDFFKSSFDNDKKLILIKNYLGLYSENSKIEFACSYLYAVGILTTIAYPFTLKFLPHNIQVSISNFATIISLGFILIAFYIIKTNNEYRIYSLLISLVSDSYNDYEKLAEKHNELLKKYKELMLQNNSTENEQVK